MVDVKIFKCLSDENRIKIIDILSKQNMCANTILKRLNITQPTLSHHMKVLSDCGLVLQIRKGNMIVYQLNKGTITNLENFIKYLKEGDEKMGEEKKCTCGCEEGKCTCDENCTCGCNGKCDENCSCGCNDKCDENCTCGCQDGEKCTCDTDCNCKKEK